MRNKSEMLRRVAFMAAFLGIFGTGMVGATTLIHVTYQINNDSDSGYYGYWALDNYTSTLTVSTTANPDVYQVSVSDIGTWCTFAGDKEPNANIAQPFSECGVIDGGYGGNLTTSVVAVNTLQTTLGNGVLNFHGTPAGILANSPTDTNDTYTSWINYFFPGTVTGNNWPAVFAFANGGNAWGWTYTDANGNLWVDNGTVLQGNSGNIATSASDNEGSVEAVADAIPQTCSLSASGALNFGDVVPGGPEVAALAPVTVTNDGDVATDVAISGSDWSSTHDGDLGASSVAWTVYNVGATFSPTAHLTASPVDTGENLAANGGSSAFSFGLAVPGTVYPATLKQTITFASAC